MAKEVPAFQFWWWFGSCLFFIALGIADFWSTLGQYPIPYLPHVGHLGGAISAGALMAYHTRSEGTMMLVVAYSVVALVLSGFYLSAWGQKDSWTTSPLLLPFVAGSSTPYWSITGLATGNTLAATTLQRLLAISTMAAAGVHLVSVLFFGHGLTRFGRENICSQFESGLMGACIHHNPGRGSACVWCTQTIPPTCRTPSSPALVSGEKRRAAAAPGA